MKMDQFIYFIYKTPVKANTTSSYVFTPHARYTVGDGECRTVCMELPGIYILTYVHTYKHPSVHTYIHTS